MKSETQKITQKTSCLGKEIKISPKTMITINSPGYRKTYYVESVEVLIGIGNNHTATLIMSKDAFDALQSGEKVDITTIQDFKRQYFEKRKKS